MQATYDESKLPLCGIYSTNETFNYISRIDLTEI